MVTDIPTPPDKWIVALGGSPAGTFTISKPRSRRYANPQDAYTAAVAALETGQNRHDTVASVVMALVATGAQELLEELEGVWEDVMCHERDTKQQAIDEWVRMVTSARRKHDDATERQAEPVTEGVTPIDWPRLWTLDFGEEWLLEPVFPRGRSISIWAEGKAGKSLILLEWCAALATGKATLLRPASEPINVVYVDNEMTELDVRERLEDMGYGPGVDLSRLHYYCQPEIPALNTPRGGEALTELADGADLVVIDTVARSTSGSENDAETINELARVAIKPLKARGITVVRLDHAGKDKSLGPRGSSAKSQDVDVEFYLDADTDPVNGNTTVKLTTRFARQRWVPPKIDLVRHDDPWLEHRIISAKPIEITDTIRETIELLVDLGVPDTAPGTAAVEALKKAGKGRKRQTVYTAQKARQKLGNTPGNTPGTPIREHFREHPGNTPSQERPNPFDPKAYSVGNTFGNTREHPPLREREHPPVSKDTGSVPTPGFREAIQTTIAGEDVTIHTYQGDEDREALDTFLASADVFGFDTETTGLNIQAGDTLRTIQLATGGDAWVIPAEHRQVAIDALERAGQLVAHNAGFDANTVLEHLGINVDAKLIDTSATAGVLDPRDRSLKTLAEIHVAPDAPDSDRELKAEAKRLGIKVADRFQEIPVDNPVFVRYAGVDAFLVDRLHQKLETDLEDEAPRTVDTVIREQALAAMLWRMQRRGMLVDQDRADTARRHFTTEYEDAMSGLETFGIKSPFANNDIAEALRARGARLEAKTSGGAVSVAKSVLDALATGSGDAATIAQLVRQAKTAHHYRDVYVDGIINRLDSDSRLHPSIKAIAARTGRMSVSDPPMQQLPADDVHVRSMFAADPGFEIIAADFGQIEARILAGYAGDADFTEAVTAGDIHAEIAALAFGEGFTKRQRTIAKRAVFGTLYGGGVTALAAQIGVDEGTMQTILDAFADRWPGVAEYRAKVSRHVAKTGEIRYPSGRRAYLEPEHAYRGVAYLVQGTARDVFADALLDLAATYDDALLLPVHDEIVMQIRQGESTEAIAKCMTREFRGVHCPVDVGRGDSWGAAK